MREPIESSAATLSARLLLAERSERIATVATIDLLMLAEPSECVTAVATTVADMLLGIRRRRGRRAPGLGLGLRRGRLTGCR